MKRLGKRTSAHRSLTTRRLQRHEVRMVDELLDMIGDSADDVPLEFASHSLIPDPKTRIGHEIVLPSPRPLSVCCGPVVSTIDEECPFSLLQIQPPRSAPSRLGPEASAGDRKRPFPRQAQRYRPSSHCGASSSRPPSRQIPPSLPKGRVDAPAVSVAARAYEALNGKQSFLRLANQRDSEILETSAKEVGKDVHWSQGGWWAKTKKIPKWDFCRITGPWANRMRAGSLQNYRQWGPDGPLWALHGAK